jgi:hypothetical protein
MSKPRKPKQVEKPPHLTFTAATGEIVEVFVVSFSRFVTLHGSALVDLKPSSARRVARALMKAADYLDNKDGGR